MSTLNPPTSSRTEGQQLLLVNLSKQRNAPETGAVYPLRRVTREELATIMADQRRRGEDEAAS